MGPEREDTDPNPKRGGTEPGLGGQTAAGGSGPTSAGGPVAVDFDALHAALGDALELDELPPAATEINADDSDQLLDGLSPGGRGDSSGRTNAQYASSRPHTIPPSYTPADDPNAPAVIVASEDTVPAAPPQMTVRVPLPRGPMHTPQSGVPFVAGHVGPAAAAGHPSSGPQTSALAYPPQTPPAFRAAPRGGVGQMTVRMPERPINPRRAKTATLVVRPRGPSARQKLLAFMTMLLLVTACGIAVIVWRKPQWLGLGPLLPLTAPALTPTPAALPLADPAAAIPAAPPSAASATATATASGSAAVAASASAPALGSALAPVRILRPRPPAPSAAGSTPATHSTLQR